MNILLIDNYDSFTFNLLHYLQNTGANVDVVRNDELTPAHFDLIGFDAVVLSPGPCTPIEAGSMMDFLKLNLGKKPVLGVCLGMQALGLCYGWEVTRAEIPVHGKSSEIVHDGSSLFHEISNPMKVGRYHSLVIKNIGDSELKITARCGNEVMAIADESKQVWGVQFHPESILTPEGQTLINNWIQAAAKKANQNF